MTDTTDPTAPSLEFVPYPQQAPNACRTTRHCADHGFCRRCQPEFSAVMSRVNSAIQRTDSDEQHWGPLYAAVTEALRGSPAAAPVVVPAADRAALRELIAERLHAQLPGCTHDDHGADCAALADAVLPAPVDPVPVEGGDLIEEYLRFLRGLGPEPDLSDLPSDRREAIAGQFEIVKALADRGPELPPIDQDPVARRLGLVPADRAAVERVRALHRPAECVNVRCKLKQWCIGCDPDGIEGCDENPWPCLTIRALDGEQPEPTVADRYGDDHSCADSGCSGEPGPAVEAQPGKDTETPQPKEA